MELISMMSIDWEGCQKQTYVIMRVLIAYRLS